MTQEEKHTKVPLQVKSTIQTNKQKDAKSINSIHIFSRDSIEEILLYLLKIVQFLFTYVSTLYVTFHDKFVSLFRITPDDNIFDDASDFEDLFGATRGGTNFLGLYTRDQIASMIKNSPLAEKIDKLGYSDWYIDFDLSDCFTHYGYVKCRSFPNPEQFLAFIICQIGEYHPSIIDLPFCNINMLNIRWFNLQNPYAAFQPDRPRLPGQRYPGTGLARDAFVMLREAAIKSKRDGIVNVPEHFHNAYGYKHFLFLNPSHQGIFERIVHDLSSDISEKGLAMVSWAIYLGFMRQGTEKYCWDPSDQVFPISRRMISYFLARKYQKESREAFKNSPGFVIDWEKAEKQCLSGILHYSESENSINLRTK
ncbi:hypothetical protein TRFO_03282 [Tritrichomonas foetus]|uniref:Uncharacterized protein n=1 Tax=Tritrichomonas foetus TaxID=1144522 RepID=A0A1J4KQH6_9EUKA|nr:hypothetical protein TRFO_03282 [Tritrichomonas foetus]|eukprot:OHT13543.1 hypothetical protein TRFO_03282 [Tritrichomonas foetus]